MTTDDTEIEAVAKALEIEWRGEADWFYTRMARAAILALDAHRASQAHGPRFTECLVCHQPGERYNPPGDEFWSHLKHPEDGHDFKPMFTPEPTVTEYPRREGDFVVIGPECFANEDRSVICWQGVNFYIQPPEPTVSPDVEWVRNGVCLACGDGVLASGEHIDPQRHADWVEHMNDATPEPTVKPDREQAEQLSRALNPQAWDIVAGIENTAARERYQDKLIEAARDAIALWPGKTEREIAEAAWDDAAIAVVKLVEHQSALTGPFVRRKLYDANPYRAKGASND